MIYKFDEEVRFSETDENGRLTLTALVNLFQDAAIFQSEHSKIGFQYLRPKNQAWLLSSWQIVINRMPVVCEPVETSTWTYDFRDFYGYRNFTLKTGEGEMLAYANSVWFICDTERQVPVKVDDTSIRVYGMEPRLDMNYLPRKIKIPEGGETMESFRVEKHHLDTNHHVNNGQYIDMASQYLSEGVKIRQVRAEYKKQARLGDLIVPVVVRSCDGYVMTVELNSEEGRPYAVIELEIAGSARGTEANV